MQNDSLGHPTLYPSWNLIFKIGKGSALTIENSYLVCGTPYWTVSCRSPRSRTSGAQPGQSTHSGYPMLTGMQSSPRRSWWRRVVASGHVGLACVVNMVLQHHALESQAPGATLQFSSRTISCCYRVFFFYWTPPQNLKFFFEPTESKNFLDSIFFSIGPPAPQKNSQRISWTLICSALGCRAWSCILTPPCNPQSGCRHSAWAFVPKL